MIGITFKKYIKQKCRSVYFLIWSLVFLCFHNFNAQAQCVPPAGISVNYVINNVTCNGLSDGSVAVTITGGGAPYSYTIFGLTIPLTTHTSASNSYTFTNLPADASFNLVVQTRISVVTFSVCTYTNLALNEPAPIAITNNLITNATCSGKNDGAIDINVSGGNTPYTYAWSNGANTEDISTLLAGTYNLTLTDAKGCTTNHAVTITEPNTITSSATTVNPTCNGGNNGSITHTSVSGGTAPYTYAWSNAANTQNISGLSSGAYSVTITDANGCFLTSNYNLSNPSAIAITSAITNVNCFAGTNGGVTISSVLNGTAPYTFLWSNGATSQNLTNVTAGAYSVTITDANGCFQIFPFTITEPSNLSLTAAPTNITCNGGNDGAITISAVSGGTAPYTYAWSNGASSQSLTNVTAGSYTLTVTDANACTYNFNYNLTEPAAITFTAVVSPTSCSGTNDGSITISTVAGGSAPYTYAWSNGATTQSIAGLGIGSYTLTITDSKFCTNSSLYTLIDPAPISAISNIVNVNCNGASNGSITLSSVTGGTAPYSYLWSNGATTSNISGLTAGVYSVTITDGVACSRVFNYNITEPAVIAITSTVNNATCFGGTNGGVTISSIANGTAPYSFLWSNGATTQNLTNVSAGAYSVSITDANGCTQTFNFTISAPTNISLTTTITNVACHGGNDGDVLLTSISGGTGPYSFVWSNGALTNNLTNVSAGTYTLVITDAASCTYNSSYTITEPNAIIITSTQTNPLCNGGNDGSITLSTVSGGIGPYSFLWSNGAITQNVTNLTASAYSVDITDANGCSQTFNFTLTDPLAIAITSTTNNSTTCGGNNGSITINTITNGTAPYTFLWNTGATTQNISGLSTGIYTLAITDANSCTHSSIFNVNDPITFSVTSSQTDVNCNGNGNGSISLVITGGTGPFVTNWTNGATTNAISGLSGGTYTVNIVDAANCSYNNTFTIHEPLPISYTALTSDVTTCSGNDGSITISAVNGGTPVYSYLWSNGAITQSITSLSAGPYSLTITDANGCTDVSNYNITSPTPFTVTPTVVDNICFGLNNGSIALAITGGTAPFTTLWNTGASTTTINGLIAGTYSVNIMDANACSYSQSFTLTDPADLIPVDNTLNTTTCGGSDGSITITSISGGTAPYSYAWSNGGATASITNLTAGNYTLTLSDANACSHISNYTINDPTSITATANIVDNVCNGQNNGSINLTISGGTAPLSILWSNGSTNANNTNLIAGVYNVVITDAASCSYNNTFTVSEPTAISLTSSTSNITTCGGNDGTITISSVTGGTPAYNYLWSNGATTQNLSGLVAGVYNLTITDANACSHISTYTLSEPTTFTVTPSINDVTCNGGNNGAINLNLIGGTAPFTILWNTGAVTNSINTLIAGVYTVSISDASGCTYNGAYTVIEPLAITTTSTTQNTSACGATDGSITITTVSGGVLPYTYLWNTGATSQNLTNIAAGNYTLAVSDANGCSNNFIFSISDPTTVAVTFNITNVDCTTNPTGSIALTISGGVLPYSILWNTGATTSTITNLTPGIYSVTITDAINCTTNRNYFVFGPVPVDTVNIIDNITTINCSGANTGAVTLTNVTGGASPYLFTLNGTSSATPTFTNLAAGNHTIQITDALSCIYFHTITITATPIIIGTFNVLQPSCGQSNGEITMNVVSGGTAPYQYSIDNGVTFVNTNIFTNLNPGSFTSVIRDANACVINSIITITPRLLPIPYIRTISTFCHDSREGAIIIDSLQGGISPFTFYFNGSNRGSSKAFTKLYAGSYEIQIEDLTCRDTVNYYYLWNQAKFSYDTISSKQIVVNAPAIISADIVTEDTDRKNETGVTVITNFTGGTPSYYYSLDTLKGYQKVVNDSVYLTGFDKGYHKVYFKDKNNCKYNYDFKVNVAFFIPNLFTPNGDGQNDYFEIMGLPRGSSLRIFNSWDSQVFYSSNYDNSWDGEGLSKGVYYYDLQLPNGDLKKGWIELIK
jgi:gliding motility-associated-like protein